MILSLHRVLSNNSAFKKYPDALCRAFNRAKTKCSASSSPQEKKLHNNCGYVCSYPPLPSQQPITLFSPRHNHGHAARFRFVATNFWQKSVAMQQLHFVVVDENNHSSHPLQVACSSFFSGYAPFLMLFHPNRDLGLLTRRVILLKTKPPRVDDYSPIYPTFSQSLTICNYLCLHIMTRSQLSRHSVLHFAEL